jgi:hypothetical protein
VNLGVGREKNTIKSKELSMNFKIFSFILIAFAIIPACNSDHRTINKNDNDSEMKTNSCETWWELNESDKTIIWRHKCPPNVRHKLPLGCKLEFSESFALIDSEDNYKKIIFPERISTSNNTYPDFSDGRAKGFLKYNGELIQIKIYIHDKKHNRYNSFLFNGESRLVIISD